MSRLLKKSLFMLILICAGFSLSISGAQAGPAELYKNQTYEPAVASYTLDELQNAKPLPLPEVVMPEGADSQSAILLEKSLQEPALPGYAPGWNPQSKLPKPDPRVTYTITPDHPLYKAAMGGADLQTYGVAPTDPLSGPYSPFQRWNWYGNYVAQGTQTIGRLFFDTDNNGTRDSSCTASVIGLSTIATASHCLKSGGPSGHWYGRYLFCPSYYRASGSGGPHPSRGCWDWNYARVSNGWVNTTNNVDRDYGCIVTSSTGDTIPNRVGNVTGWTARAWNWASVQPMVSWGYPAVSPFPGYHITVASSPEWYEVDMVPGDGQVSKYMGNDMTGGSSGGPWWMSVRHRTYEYKDTDGYSTDPPGCSNCVPGGPYINGVNSHRRCRGSCFTPPTSSAGTFWQEMGSAQFRGTGGDTDESEDIFQACYANQ